MSCDLAASALSPHPTTSEVRRDRFLSDANGDASGDRRLLSEAAEAQLASAGGGFRDLLKIARDTDLVGSALARTRSAAPSRRSAEAPESHASFEPGLADVQADVQECRSDVSSTSTADADATDYSFPNDMPASARRRTQDPDDDGRNDDAPGETDDDRAADASPVIGIPVMLPVQSAFFLNSAASNADATLPAFAGGRSGQPVSAASAAEAAGATPEAAVQNSAAPLPSPSVRVQSVGEPVLSVPAHALLASVMPLDTGGDAPGVMASSQNGATGIPAQHTASAAAAASAGASGHAAPPPSTDALGTATAPGTGLNAHAAATSQNLVDTGGCSGGGTKDRGTSDRDPRSAEALLDADLAVNGTEEGFAAGAATIARNTASPRTGVSSAAAAAAYAIPTVQVAQQLGKAVRSGLQRVEIALEPAALGRIDVRLEFGRDGRVAAHFTADSREALNALQADTRTLERALQDAGVRADAGSLGFSLRGESGGDHRSSFASRASTSPEGLAQSPGDTKQARISAFTGVTVPDGRLDIRA